MFCSALRYLRVVISVGTKAGRASYGGNRRYLVSKRLFSLLLILGKEPRCLGIEAMVQQYNAARTSCKQWTGEKVFSYCICVGW